MTYVYDAARDGSDLVDPRRRRLRREAGGHDRPAPARAVRLPRELDSGRGVRVAAGSRAVTSRTAPRAVERALTLGGT